MIRPQIILGPPGTGKTTRLLQIMEQEIQSGVPPQKIAFCSFTRKAADEAAHRASQKFGYERSDLPFFRTLHSLAHRQLGVKHGEVMDGADYRVIGNKLGINFSWRRFEEEGGIASEKYMGDRFAQLDGLAKAKIKSPQDIWASISDEELDWHRFRQYCVAVNDYKKLKKKIDFNDMLMADMSPAYVDVAIIDEAQDLSMLQWQFVKKAFKNVKRIYIAGDDDQAIFEWGGAAVDFFIDLDGDRTVLEQSYRIPQSVHALAENISSQITHRSPKVYHPREHEGCVEWHNNLESVDFVDGTWLLLARNSYHLDSLVGRIRDAGIPYMYKSKPAINPEHIRAIQAWEASRKGRSISPDDHELVRSFLPVGKKPDTIWHEAFSRMAVADKEYYISLLRRGESLTKTPRINISTIHGVKGGEADHVLLVTDITNKTREAMIQNPDSEHRCFYVAATRTKNTLHLLAPMTRSSYTI